MSNKLIKKSVITDMVIKGVGRGMTIQVACDYAGISYRTLLRWMKETPAIEAAIRKTKADYAMGVLLPKVEEKEPWKLLKSLYKGEYTDTPETQVNVNVEMDRPLINVPSQNLLKILKTLKQQKQIPENNDEAEFGE